MDELNTTCPYCGAIIGVLVDNSVQEQEYYEDCSVCCCPILFNVVIDSVNNIKLVVRRDDE